MNTWDKILLAVAVCVSVLGLILSGVLAQSSGADLCVVEVNGSLYAKYALKEIISTKYIEIRTEYGYNKIELSENGVKMIEADCPDQRCRGQVCLSQTGGMLVCLPHRLVVRLTGADSADVVAY